MLKEIGYALWHSALGKLGLAMLAILVFASLYVLFTFPKNFGDDVWNNPTYWADNPKAAPPAWTAWFDKSKARHLVEKTSEILSKRFSDNGEFLVRYEMPFSRRADHVPSFVSFSVDEIRFSDDPINVEVYLKSEDSEVFIWQHRFQERFEGEEGVIYRFSNEPFRANLTSDEYANKQIKDFFEGMHLRGRSEFTFVVEASMSEQEDSLGSLKAVIGGDVYGISGTDTIGRDIWQALLYGVPVALLVGILAPLLMVFIGTMLGGVSAYYGGVVDILIQRLVDIVGNVPLLPIMLFLIFVFGPRLEYVILILGLVGWTGLAIQLRPLIFQIKTSGFVEYFKAMGCPSSQILFGHVIPQTIPYIVAHFIFFVPAAILTEASISFLGLGDSSIPTWGQILQQGFNTGAQYLGYWWWIVPPGLAIVMTTVAFYLKSAAVEHLAEPRMRRG